jgi:hypothetical protein
VAEISRFQVAGLALGGGLTVKILDIVYLEIRRRLERAQTATRFVDEHLDPLLKTADELVGKLQSLGRSDFKPLRAVHSNTVPADNNDLGSLMFLFARFWANLEIIKREGLSVAISRDKRGERLQKFMDCLESRRVRLIDRTAQRAIAETSLEASNGKLRTMSYIEFVRCASEPEVSQWLDPLKSILVRGWHTGERQKLLQYATVVHALIDSLDERHLVTRHWPTIPNKLSRRSWRDLNYRVFGVYLRFVKKPQKYLGLPRREAQRGKAVRRNF